MANGELLWATKSRLGKVKTQREYITTINVSIDGAKFSIAGRHLFPLNAHARLKLGIEFCEVEVLEVDRKSMPNNTILRVSFVAPTPKFVSVVEKWMPISTDDREEHISSWT